MQIQQLSVFIENKPGRMAEVTEVLAEANIDIRAISVADTRDFGILRVIVDKPKEAVEALKAADAELQLRFSPALGRRAAQYLARITGGRYDAVAVSRDFSVAARLKGDAQQRDSLYMSAGAADALYLALRLAIVDLTLPAEEPCPIVLDDALASVDAARRGRIMELLEEIAEKRQVILFTCTDIQPKEEK